MDLWASRAVGSWEFIRELPSPRRFKRGSGDGNGKRVNIEGCSKEKLRPNRENRAGEWVLEESGSARKAQEGGVGGVGLEKQ